MNCSFLSFGFGQYIYKKKKINFRPFDLSINEHLHDNIILNVIFSIALVFVAQFCCTRKAHTYIKEIAHTTFYTRLHTFLYGTASTGSTFTVDTVTDVCQPATAGCGRRTMEFCLCAPVSQSTSADHHSKNREHKGPQKTGVSQKSSWCLSPSLVPACRHKNRLWSCDYHHGFIYKLVNNQIQTASVLLTCKMRFKCNQMLIARPKTFYFLFS